LSVSKPDTKVISNAARKLGLKNKVQKDSHFSKTWYEKRGRVLILSKKDKNGDKFTKVEIIAKIAKRLRTREKRMQDK